MILPTYTEDEILQELIEDFQTIKRVAKGIADDFYAKAKKGGRFIRETVSEGHYRTTRLNNKWFINIEYNQKYRTPWLYRACCITEGSNKSKDYYLIRGLSSEQPYFIKITTHALKRSMERNNMLMENADHLELYACRAFDSGETGVGVKYLNWELIDKMMDNNIDIKETMSDISYMVMTLHGLFFAYRTPKGNYIFKTFVSPEMSYTELRNIKADIKTKYHKEGEHLDNLLIIHQYYNKRLYPLDILKGMLYKHIDESAELVPEENSPYVILNS